MDKDSKENRRIKSYIGWVGSYSKCGVTHEEVKVQMLLWFDGKDSDYKDVDQNYRCEYDIEDDESERDGEDNEDELLKMTAIFLSVRQQSGLSAWRSTSEQKIWNLY